MNQTPSLVDARWVAAHLDAPDVRVLDVRWSLADPRAGYAKYVASHVPGAVFVDLDTELARPDDGTAGRHPLPARVDFERAMRRAGVGASTHVVIYDDLGGIVAARAWWLLKAFGHTRVSLLDGGFTAWEATGHALEQGVVSVLSGDFEATESVLPALDLEGFLAARARGARVVDVRAPERYRGETEPVDARAGHVPGALNLSLSELSTGGRLRSVEGLRKVLEPFVQDAEGPIVASCGSGVTACFLLFALERAGVRAFGEALLYEGSFSEWARHFELPVSTGDEV